MTVVIIKVAICHEQDGENMKERDKDEARGRYRGSVRCIGLYEVKVKVTLICIPSLRERL